MFYELFDCENLEFQTDKNRLVQILINLISNAIKYTNIGCVKILGRLNQQNLIISVVDTGVGISTEKISSLFTPFCKITENRNFNLEGVGLGLTISKNLA